MIDSCRVSSDDGDKHDLVSVDARHPPACAAESTSGGDVRCR